MSSRREQYLDLIRSFLSCQVSRQEHELAQLKIDIRMAQLQAEIETRFPEGEPAVEEEREA